MQLKNKIFLTFDVDWAPDHMVDQLIDICLEKSLKATFFVTHNGPHLSRLTAHSDLFEIGIHPNFLPGSTQGQTEEEVFEYCKDLVPDVVSVRTHCVYQHGKLYSALNKHFAPRLVESSICMPGIDNIRPFELYTSSGCVVRVPFFWADDYYLLGKQVLNPVNLLKSEGCKVYMFHPVHTYHNTISVEHYETIKKKILVQKYKNKGTLDLFNELINEIIKNQLETGLMREFLNFIK